MIRKIFNGPVAIFVMLLVLFFSLKMISSSTMDAEEFQQLYYLLLTVNLVILLMLVFLIARQAWRLSSQLRQHVAGAKLTLRMVIIFVSLAVLPALVVYSFSIQFIHRSIDSWFDVTVEQALEDAMDLSRSAVDEKKKALLRQIRRLSDEILTDINTISVVSLSEIREKSGVDEVTLMTSRGRILGSSSVEEGDIVPDIPSSDLLLPLQQGRDHVVLDLSEKSDRMIRVLVRITFEGEKGFLILQAMVPLSGRQYRLAASVQQAFSEYKGLVYLRKPLKISFTLTLSLVLLLGILSAVWAAFYSARRIAAPIRDLAEGTKAVAEGEYHKPIPLLNDDDFGLLIQSFNKMVRRLSQTHNALEESHQQAKSQRDYLEVVLNNLSSGIISLTQNKEIRTSNPEASVILGVNVNDFHGLSLFQLTREKPELESLIRWIMTTVQNKVKHWSEEVTLMEADGRKNLLCRGNALADGGYVIVIENITSLVQAQRDAAWGEVARRLAHEIKNPLTPIQLSAERLRHKYLKTMNAKDAETMDRLTSTIINQVDSMKEMVKAFSEYAKMPELRMQPVDIEKLLMDVVELYRGSDKLTIYSELSISGTMVEADSGRLRQVFHNVIKNAVEASVEQEKRCFLVRTQLMESNSQQWCVLILTDNGPGFPEDMLANIFEPYVTNKPKGTGLGLAIVKKIIEEHGGTIVAENAAEGGAKVVIQLPVV
ncbi:sensor histidine kinase [sulfur-oxidizing endosymbiont of Gigantopelta aegis]|uniref:sensor histidine kinase n=1 Tax=sulfur-oxidizing endosymbiont of Gigantopelta aegis TaxID=2794934 RepID=UPI0018DBDE60|nr:ATP-binding protein [sulfur-oxidizing endosymbiont of Gigantopelta aegis]